MFSGWLGIGWKIEFAVRQIGSITKRPPAYEIECTTTLFPCIVMIDSGWGGGTVEDGIVLNGEGHREYYFWLYGLKLCLLRTHRWSS